MKHPLFFLLAVAMIVACKPQENASAQQPPTAANAPSGVKNLVQLETGGCRGYCPMYKLTFRKDGNLDYLGIRNVAIKGAKTIRLSTEEYSELLKAVNRVDLWQYPAVIPSSVVDAPVHTYTIFEGSKSHVVKATADIPKPILALESRMQDIAEAHGLTVRKGEDPNNPSLAGQVIARFKMDVNAKVFCNQFTDLKIRPVRLLSEDNTWIIGFDPSELSLEQFINLLKDMDGVINVEPNRQGTGH